MTSESRKRRPAGKKKPRRYNSPLRTVQAEQTREQILDALVRALARDGIADLSVPLVAREAGVSIATVYRHFPTKRDLMAAVVDYGHRKGGFEVEDEFPSLETPEDLADVVPELFKRREAIDPTVFAALGSRAGYEIRRPLLKARRAYFSKIVKPAVKGLSRQEKDWFRDTVFVLTSSTGVRAFRDYLGLDTDEAAKRVAWALRALSRGASPDAKGRGGKS